MIYFFLGLLVAALWASTNYFDKYIVEKYFSGSGAGALMIFSSLVIGLVVAPIALIVKPDVLDIGISTALTIIPLGWIYIAGILPYLYAIQKGDISVVVPIWQLIPVMAFFLDIIFLDESFHTSEIAGGLLIVAGSLALSFEREQGSKITFRYEPFVLMLLSSAMFAASFTLFKVFAVETDYWTTVFWEYIGFVLFGIGLLAVGSYRKQFFSVLKHNRVKVLSLNMANEIINISGKLLFNIVSLSIPVTLVWLAVGFQPVFNLIFSILLTLFFPMIVSEKISKHHLMHKVGCVSVMLIGVAVMYL